MIKKIVDPLEKSLLFSLAILVSLFYTEVFQSQTLIVIGLILLAIVLFASAFIPPEIFNSQEEADAQGPLGMMDLLTLTIAPKVLSIGSSVSVLGLVMYITKPGAQSYLQLTMIGGSSIMICLVLFGFGVLSGTKLHRSIYKAIVYGILLLLVDYYLFF